MTPPLRDVAVAAGLSFVGTWAACRLARRLDLLDRPEARRLHATPTPRMGGVGWLCGVAPTLLATPARGVALAVVAFFLVGLADDLGRRGRGLPTAGKLALQVLAAALAVGVGDLRIEGRAEPPWPALVGGGGAAVATALWFLVVVNVVNFLDGIDTISAIVGAVLLTTAAAHGGPGADVALAGAGALAGFSPWNASPARAFLGDGGSHALGALVACGPCVGATAGGGALPWVVAAAALSRYAVDVGEALLRKLALGVPLGRAHEDHLYQRLVKAGQPPLFVATHYGLVVLGCAGLVGPGAADLGAATALGAAVALLAAHVIACAWATRRVPRTLVP